MSEAELKSLAALVMTSSYFNRDQKLDWFDRNIKALIEFGGRNPDQSPSVWSALDYMYSGMASLLATGYGPHNQKRFAGGHDGVRQRRVGRLVREVLFTSEEPDEGTALAGDLVAQSSAQRGIARLECVEN